jgi:hypothetical protein
VATHQLIISKDANPYYPVRFDAGQYKVVTALVVHWKGTWAPNDRPEQYLLVAPGDEVEITQASAMDPGGCVWLFKQALAALLPANDIARQDAWERVDVDGESALLHLNPALARDTEEIRYELRISDLGQKPEALVGPAGSQRPPRY